MDGASATETVNWASIPNRVKPKTIKIGIHSFPAWRSAIKRNSVKPPPCVVGRPGAPGGHTGAVPPQNKNCAPPSEDCAPKKLTGSGLLERKSRSKLVFFVDWHQILWRFWNEDLFFWRSPVFGRKNRLNLRFRPENPFDFLLLTLFTLGWIFRAPVPLSNSHKIKFSCPPKIYLCPSQSRYPGAGFGGR